MQTSSVTWIFSVGSGILVVKVKKVKTVKEGR